MSKRTTAAVVATIGLAGAAAYNFRRQLWQRALELPPVRNDVVKQSTVYLPMPDGVKLATDIYTPKAGGVFPTILIRTPYGRANFLGAINIQRIAERGYNVVSQDCRGRFDSDGEFEPYVHEAADGQATIEWIAAQSWSDGQVGMWGQSYVGYVQWAAASTGTPHLKAIVPSITSSYLAFDPEKGYQLDLSLRWLYLLDAMDNDGRSTLQTMVRLTSSRQQDRTVAEACDHLPISTADEAMIGEPVPFFRTWVESMDDESYWRAVDHRSLVADMDVPACHVTGWYDLFLEGELSDFVAMQAAGKGPYLTVGPWAHRDFGVQWESLRAGLDWFDAHMKGQMGRLRAKPVRLYVMGADEWREYDNWPPATAARPLFLHQGGRLSADAPAADEQPDHYRYDPADPTPNVGGALLSTHAGARDNRELEARPDVLTYTTDVLTEPLEIAGLLTLKLYVQSSREYADFLGRLCDVHPDGRSINICDGIFRVVPGAGEAGQDGSLSIEFELTPTAYSFQPGHRVRLQVSSGAHPRIARNPGTGESPVHATELLPADQTVFHDATRPSVLILPVSV